MMTLLLDILMLLSVTISVIIIFQKLHIPTSLGYLLVGIILGEYTFGPTIHFPQLHALAEFGVVFLLFSIGLNYSLPQLHALRGLVLGFGTGQVVLTTLLVMIILYAIGLPITIAFVFGAIFAQSSTTIIASLLKEQGEENSQHGRLGVAISVFQDVTAVPFLVIIPVLGVSIAANVLALSLGVALAKAVLAFAIVFFAGRWVLSPLFHLVSASKSAEAFTLTVLLVALLAAWTTNHLGLSLAFGGFLAGMMLGETAFRHQIESTIRPFRDVLLGLFFVGIGMRVDPSAIPPIWHWTVLGALLILLSKVLIVATMLRYKKMDTQIAWRTGLLLSVGGEFGLALIAIALDAKVLTMQFGQIAISSVLLAMILGAILIRFNGTISSLLVTKSAPTDNPPIDSVAIAEQSVIVAGYGRVGHTVSVLLETSGVPFIAFDGNINRVLQGKADNHPVVYGDMSDPTLLQTLHVERAALVIITVDNSDTALHMIYYLRRTYPQIPIIARARDIETSKQLLQAGAMNVYPETVEASLLLGTTALEMLQVPQANIEQVIQDLRDKGYKPILNDEKKL